MSNIFIRTLNSIRNAERASGRDVAEAFDTVSQEFIKIKQTVQSLASAAEAAASTPAVQKVSAQPSTGPAASSKSSTVIIPPSGPSQVTEVTGNYTMVAQDSEIQITALSPSTIQLLGSVENTRVTIKNYSADSIVITIQDSASGTVDGGTNIQMKWKNTAADFVFDGTSNWAVS